ncbi:MAG: hypothetical protein Q8P18_32035 [Pseudomonadota bacterium]|nr:hypothetical protein [Pseudomonadota bacterium]
MTGLLLFLAACGLATPAAPTGAVQFPHAEGYDAGIAHGPEARAAGADTCLGCHREDSASGDQGAPTCASCHAGYPHAEGWLAGATHRGAGDPTCLTCHGVSGLSAPACTTCHGSYPHPPSWADAGQHGAWTIARGSATASCGACHGADLTGGTAAVEGAPVAPACTSCHATWPHPPGWAEAHAPPPSGTADLATCAACHGEAGTGGTSGVACARCHATYPHAEGWIAGHIPVAGTVGEAVCLDCHAAGEGSAAMPAACGASCHGGTP